MTATVTLPDGTAVPALGQGTWHMGENAAARDAEIHALQAGIDHGLTLIDTAEMYGSGGAERVTGRAIAGRRDEVFLVSKVFPHNADPKRMRAACEASLQRLGTDCIDLYLLHWPGGVPLADTLAGFEGLQNDGLIRRWGVSNFDVAGMRDWLNLAGGAACSTDQVLYHLGSRGIEYDLLPWCRERALPVMAYCPLGQGRGPLQDARLHRLAAEAGMSPAQLMLAWVMHNGDVMAIPKAGTLDHVADNAGASDRRLDADTMAALETCFPAPTRKQPLAIV
ncbi:aldo/keto reductase [Spectribacter hydrogenoxidans]|uniref:Aldo/keto reductase n=1 Tax=Spectribacter hydrogenoxidans TaxID=3075608 RepID=A0ABU3BX51_9GAMM|nr:aldo/keto reductase [Salinisphaera sp. W335]MDT0633696.1 aldo/keto reductase [Salinisphaera sp. W335]